MRPGSAALVAAAVLLAGCGGLPMPDGGDGGPTVATPVSVEPRAADSAPGVLDGQVASPDALGRAHADAIENESYVLTSNRTVRAPNGSLESGLAVEVAIDEERRFLATVSTEGPDAPVFVGEPPAEAVYWSDGSTYLRRLTLAGRTTYVEFGPPDTWVGTWYYWAKTVPFGGSAARPATFYAGLFGAVPDRVDGQRTLDGRRVVRIVNEGDRPFSDAAFPGRVESVHDVSMVALVDRDGLVRSLDLRYAGVVEGEPVRVHRTVRYAGVGTTTVERPAWYDRAASGSADRDAAAPMGAGPIP